MNITSAVHPVIVLADGKPIMLRPGMSQEKLQNLTFEELGGLMEQMITDAKGPFGEDKDFDALFESDND